MHRAAACIRGPLSSILGTLCIARMVAWCPLLTPVLCVIVRSADTLTSAGSRTSPRLSLQPHEIVFKMECSYVSCHDSCSHGGVGHACSHSLMATVLFWPTALPSCRIGNLIGLHNVI